MRKIMHLAQVFQGFLGIQFLQCQCFYKICAFQQLLAEKFGVQSSQLQNKILLC